MSTQKKPRPGCAPTESGARALDQNVRDWLASTSKGLSPLALSRAYFDWAMHMAVSPGHQLDLMQKAFALGQHAISASFSPITDAEHPEKDSRFSSAGWEQLPYRAFKEGFKASEKWWHKAAQLEGMTRQDQRMVDFFTRQALDAYAPSNWALTNPDVFRKAMETNGASLRAGFKLFLHDLHERFKAKANYQEDELPPLSFEVGKDVAVTPGKVVWRNHLVELIQYSPSTAKVLPEPVLIIPSTIMKYYILDLSPHNSMVSYLVAQGHTVFIISWRNPDESDCNLKIRDYLSSGILHTMAAVRKITAAKSIHTIGYCLGGTYLAMVAAVLGRLKITHGTELSAKEKQLIPQDLPDLASVTLLAAQVDFVDPGELGVFIDEEQLTNLRHIMYNQGYLSGKQMGGTFQFLGSRDLVWSRNAKRYLLGEEDASFDLMSWNMDQTRLPARMHDEYLTALFLNNALASGQFHFAGKTIALTDIQAPMFVVGTLRDHVSPWRSVYKIHLLTDVPITFVLTSGGHNAGIVSEPGRPRRSYQIATAEHGHAWVDPDDWAEQTPTIQGSWWPAMHAWLKQHSGAPLSAQPIPEQHVLCDAPGTYVHMRYAE